MKNLLVFCIICSFGVPIIMARPNSLESYNKQKQAAKDCGEEFYLDGETYFQKPQIYTIGDQTCMGACMARQLAADYLIGSSNKETLYNIISKIIDEDYNGGFVSFDFTYKDVVDSVEHCNVTEYTECGFFECVLRNQKLFFDLYFYFNNRLHLAETLFNLS